MNDALPQTSPGQTMVRISRGVRTHLVYALCHGAKWTGIFAILTWKRAEHRI